jgi:DNA-binding winged helix-turn-helix (wHTH) protein
MDPGQRLLSRDGQLVLLTPKEYDTLLVLVEAGGSVVDKDTLIARVWPDSFVGDGSLARNISVLRKALGEEVIETLPRVGYRLAVPINMSPIPSGSRPLELAKPPEQVKLQAQLAPQLNRRFAVGLALAAAALISFLVVASRFFAVGRTSAHTASGKTDSIHSVFIAKNGALDPLDEGFKMYAPDRPYQHAMRNSENNGFDRWKLMTDDLNYYYRPLTDSEKEFAIGKDWKLTCVCAIQQGAAFAVIDFGKYRGAPRFDMEFLQEGNKYFVALTKQISPTFEFEKKIEFPGIADIDHPHTYELRYDHLSRTASLWIDGQQMASSYRGHDQFREDVGLDFGVARYLSTDASMGVFRTVRFEAY